MNKWNHYICEECGGTTTARHDDEGVTPFMVRCRAKDNEPRRCRGYASSTFFSGPQNEDQVAHIVFFRPRTEEEAVEAIKKEPKRFRDAIIDHYRQGGALMRDEWKEALT